MSGCTTAPTSTQRSSYGRERWMRRRIANCCSTSTIAARGSWNRTKLRRGCRHIPGRMAGSMKSEPGGWGRVYGGVALTSLATLLFELSLTRIFSVVFYYHFAFLAISIALFGLGAGGVFSYFLPANLPFLIPLNTLLSFL